MISTGRSLRRQIWVLHSEKTTDTSENKRDYKRISENTFFPMRTIISGTGKPCRFHPQGGLQDEGLSDLLSSHRWPCFKQSGALQIS